MVGLGYQSETFGWCCQYVSVAHPANKLRIKILKQNAIGRDYAQFSLAVLGSLSGDDLTPIHTPDEVQAVADAQDWNAQL